MNKNFVIQTKNGFMFDPKTGTIDKIDINDIAHALSNLSRYAGHCKKFYSVAEHSVLVFHIVRKLWPQDLEAQWAALLHDATEAYVGDVPTPLKVLLPEYIKIEEKLSKKIAKQFKIKWTKEIHKKVKFADLAALATEAFELFDDVDNWEVLKHFERHSELLSPTFPNKPTNGKLRFLFSFKTLMKLKGLSVHDIR